MIPRVGTACAIALLLASTTIGAAASARLGDRTEPGASQTQWPKLSKKNSIIVLTRAKQGRLNARAAEPTVSPIAFSKELGRTFIDDDGAPSAHSQPIPLPTTGNLASGFVAKVDGLGDLCAFAVGGLDFSGNGGADGLDAKAAMIMCAKDQAGLARLTDPERVAKRLGLLQPK